VTFVHDDNESSMRSVDPVRHAGRAEAEGHDANKPENKQLTPIKDFSK
jgi:hypothetical protein